MCILIDYLILHLIFTIEGLIVSTRRNYKLYANEK